MVQDLDERREPSNRYSPPKGYSPPKIYDPPNIEMAFQIYMDLQIYMALQIESPPNVWGVKKNTSRNIEDRVTSTQTLYAPNKKAVCENIEHENQEMKGERISKYKNH